MISPKNVHHFLWGKYHEEGKGETGYQTIASSQKNREFTRPNSIVIGRVNLANTEVDAFSLSYKDNVPVFSHYFYQQGLAWERTNNRRFLYEHHLILDDDQALDIVVSSLINTAEHVKKAINFNKIYLSFEMLPPIKLRSIDTDKGQRTVRALTLLKENSQKAKIARVILNSIILGKKIAFLNVDLALNDRLDIFDTVGCLLPYEYIDEFTFSTHSYNQADRGVVNVRFYEGTFPSKDRSTLYLDFRWLEEDLASVSRETEYIKAIENALVYFSCDEVGKWLDVRNVDEFIKKVSIKIAVYDMQKGVRIQENLFVLLEHKVVSELIKYRELIADKLPTLLRDDRLAKPLIGMLTEIKVQKIKVIRILSELSETKSFFLARDIWDEELSLDEKKEFYNYLSRIEENGLEVMLTELAFSGEDRYDFYQYLIEEKKRCTDSILEKAIALLTRSPSLPLLKLSENRNQSLLEETYLALLENKESMGNGDISKDTSINLSILAILHRKRNFLSDEWFSFWYPKWHGQGKKDFIAVWKTNKKGLSCSGLGVLAKLAQEDFISIYEGTRFFCTDKDGFISAYITELKKAYIRPKSEHENIVLVNKVLHSDKGCYHLDKWIEKLPPEANYENLQIKLLYLWKLPKTSNRVNYTEIIKYVNNPRIKFSDRLKERIYRDAIKNEVEKIFYSEKYLQWNSDNARSLFNIVRYVQNNDTTVNAYGIAGKLLDDLKILFDRRLDIHRENEKYLNQEEYEDYYKALSSNTQKALLTSSWVKNFENNLEQDGYNVYFNNIKMQSNLTVYFRYYLQRLDPDEFVTKFEATRAKLQKRYCKKICETALAQALDDVDDITGIKLLDHLDEAKIELEVENLITNVSTGIALIRYKINKIKIEGEKIEALSSKLDYLPKKRDEKEEYKKTKKELDKVLLQIRNIKKKFPKPRTRGLLFRQRGVR